MKACVFIDGENFRRSLLELLSADGFRQEDYLPRVRWDSFFDCVVEECLPEARRLRCYWYVIEEVGFWPHLSGKAAADSGEWARKNARDIKQFFGIAVPCGDGQIAQIIAELRDREKKVENRFKSFRVFQRGISASCRSIEFRRSGSINCNLFPSKKGKLGAEKTVDVNMAVDMVRLSSIYDVAVVVSGDQDFVPAVQAVKNLGKHVINVAFQRDNGDLLPGGARRLNMVADWAVSIPRVDICKHLISSP